MVNDVKLVEGFPSTHIALGSIARTAECSGTQLKSEHMRGGSRAIRSLRAQMTT